MPALHLIAGPDGAGKTMLYEYMVAQRHPEIPFVCPNPQAGEDRNAVESQAHQRCVELLDTGGSFAYECVLHHSSQLALIEQARAKGYEVVLYALGVDDLRKLAPRVAQRVREGAHPLSPDALLARYAGTLANYRRAVRMVDIAFLLDAVDAHDQWPRLIASVVLGRLHSHTVTRPPWIRRVLAP